jgi:hypothetical protein
MNHHVGGQGAIWFARRNEHQFENGRNLASIKKTNIMFPASVVPVNEARRE